MMGMDLRRLIFAIPVIIWLMVYTTTTTLLDSNMRLIMSTIIALASFGLLYLVYFSYNKTRHKKIQYRICPKCLIRVDKEIGICPECGQEL